jgi:hypothetical protein
VARPHILGALVEAASYGLRNLPKVRLERLPRMADFAIWSAACETALWPAGTFLRAYDANRKAALEDVIEADPVAARVREFMAERTAWTGNASDLLRIGADASRGYMSERADGWPKSPRALAGRLRRAQTLLRAFGIEIAFSREGRVGTRIIRLHATQGHRPNRSSAPSVRQQLNDSVTRKLPYGKQADQTEERVRDADGADGAAQQWR